MTSLPRSASTGMVRYLPSGRARIDDVGARGGLGGGDRDRAGREDLDGERDLRRVAGAGDEHAVAGGDGEPGEHGADLAGAEDADRADGARRSNADSPAARRACSRTMGITLRAVELDGAQAGADRLRAAGVDEVEPADVERAGRRGRSCGRRSRGSRRTASRARSRRRTPPGAAAASRAAAPMRSRITL